MQTDTTPNQCPNRGPGRYEGQQYPCIAALLEESGLEWSALQIGDTETIGHAAFWDFIPEKPEDFESCEKCLSALGERPAHPLWGIMPKPYGFGLFTDSNGFVTVEIYPSEADYKAAVEHAEKAEAEYNQCPRCEGTGKHDEFRDGGRTTIEVECSECEGSGQWEG